MISSFAIGNTAAVAPFAPTSNAAPSDGIASLLNSTARSGGAPIPGDGQLMAGALRRRPASPEAMQMKSWSDALKARVAPGAAKPVESDKPLVIPVSDPGKSTPAPARFNNIGGTTWKVPGVPEFTGQIKRELLTALDRALTPQRVRAFQNLSEGQQITARTLLGAGLRAMSLPEGSAGRIDPKYMGMVVEAALKCVQQTPTALDAPGMPGVRTPTTKPVQPTPPARTPTSKPVSPTPPARTPTTAPVALAMRTDQHRPPAPRRGSDGAAKADASSLLPRRGARYGNLNLSIGGLAQSLPGLNVNPPKSRTNCIGAAVALDRQRGGAPASARALDVSDPADLYTLYGKLPEQGFGAHVNGDYLLPPYERFDMASLQRYVASLPNSARGILLVHYGTFNAGHALVVEKVNGRVVFLDGQSGLVVDPKAISSGAVVLPQMAGSHSAASHLADLPDVSLEFLRTDSVTRLNPLPKGTRQGVVVEADLGAQRVRVVDTTRVRGDEWVDVSGDPDFLSQIRPGENVFVVDDAVAGRTMHTYLIPQSAMPGY